MSNYCYTTPTLTGVGSISEAVLTLVAEVDPGVFYRSADDEDQPGGRVLTELAALLERASPKDADVLIRFRRSAPDSDAEFSIVRAVQIQ